MILALIASIILLIFNIQMKPCNVSKINTIKTASYIGIIYSIIMSIWAYTEPPTYRLPLVFYCIGLVLIVVGLIISLSGYIKKKRDYTQAILSQVFTESTVEKTPLLKVSNDK